MCGRFTLTIAANEVATLFDVVPPSELPPEARPRYNIAPTQPIATISSGLSGRALHFRKWGLIPSWSNDPSIATRLINARGETLAEKPAFREPFRLRRCLIPADGFYEWKESGSRRIPCWFHRPDHAPFAFAGLWERRRDATGAPVETCTIINTSANDLMRPLHERMPVVLPRETWSEWLDPKQTDVRRLSRLLIARPNEEFRMREVSLTVNNARVDTPECLGPYIEQPEPPRAKRRRSPPDRPTLWDV